MTAFRLKGIYYELTLYMDLWNNEILSHSLSAKRGDRMTYISGLHDLIELKKQHPEYRTVLHSDQGSVYASKNYNDQLPFLTPDRQKRPRPESQLFQPQTLQHDRRRGLVIMPALLIHLNLPNILLHLYPVLSTGPQTGLSIASPSLN